MTKKSTPFDAERLSVRLKHFAPAETYWVGYSGGADSTALLYALNELKTTLELDIRAIHFNHGLHPDSDQWQLQCSEVCAGLGIELKTESLTIDRSSGLGIEAEARRLRYSFVEKTLNSGDCFVTGHHRDDQTETLLLNLVRGSGVDGLAGMPDCRPLGRGFLIRPLLSFPMMSFRHYLEDKQIPWIEDPSNEDQSYDRNFVRKTLIPQLSDRWPAVSERIAHSADLCRQASTTLSGFCAELLDTYLVHKQIFRVGDLNPEEPLFALMLRQWLRMNAAPPLPFRQMAQLQEQLAQAAAKHHITICWQGWVVHYYRQMLWIQMESTINHVRVREWSDTNSIQAGSGLGSIGFDPLTRPMLPDQELRPRQGGEKIRVAGSEHERDLKELFQQAGIPPWLRKSIPLLFSSDELIAVGDFVISQKLTGWIEESNTSLKWRPTDPVLVHLLDRIHGRTIDHSGTVG